MAGRTGGQAARREAAVTSGRLLLASALLLAAMLAVAVAVARVPSAYAVLEGGRVAEAVSPRSWLAPVLVAVGCAGAGLWCLLTAVRRSVGRGSVGGRS